MARQTIRQFILECLAVSDKADLFGAKKCTGMSLVHVQGSQEIELKTVKFGAKAHDPKDLAQLFEGTADNYAGGIPGVQQFVLLGFFDDDTSPRARYPFRKAADPDHTGLGTEAPTTAGITQQLMRHTEASTRISSHLVTDLFDRMNRIIDRQDATIERLTKEQTDTIELAKELILRQAADTHTRTLELMRVKQSAKDRDTLMRLAPPLVNRLTGKEIFPQALADTAVLEHLAETLEPEQVQKLSTILKPEQWAMIADRLVKLVEARVARERAEKELDEAANRKIEIRHEDPSTNGASETSNGASDE